MKVKKYVASSMSEAMKKIREELGSEAVILSSKPVFSNGFIGLFKKRSIEVVAAIDPPPFRQPTQKQKQKIPHKKPAERPSVYEIKTDQKLQQTTQQELVKDVADIKSMIQSFGKPNSVHYPPAIQQVSNILSEHEVSSLLQDEFLGNIIKKWHENPGESDVETVNSWLEAELVKKISGISNWGAQFQKNS